MNGGNYAQIVQSTAKVFDDSVKPTPVAGFAGSVHHVTEKPGFGLQVAESQQQPQQQQQQHQPRSDPEDLPLESLFKHNNIDDEDTENLTPTGIASRIQQRIALKKSTQQDFRARLKNRFDRFKSQQTSAERNIGRGSVAQISLQRNNFGRSSESGFGGRSSSRERSREVGRSLEVVPEPQEPQVESVEQTIGSRAPRQRFRERSRIRPAASRIRPVTIELKKESVEELLANKPVENPTSRPSFGSRSRNRFRDRISTSRRQETRVTTPTPSVSNHFKPSRPKKTFGRENIRLPSLSDEEPGPTAPRITFKKFNRFSRPDIRQSLLQKILGKGKGKNTVDPEEQEQERKKQQLQVGFLKQTFSKLY